VGKVRDSLAVDIQKPDGDAHTPRFVILKAVELDKEIAYMSKKSLRERISPPHVPDARSWLFQRFLAPSITRRSSISRMPPE
jgi:hypothetical protein